MKNLKKMLSLALVLVMALGLFVTASAEEYKDQDSIKYTEAVDVLSGIGILEGLPDGSFNPKGDVTRAQAAKILAYLMLGKNSADALIATSNPFDDVDANHWAAGYVQYCVNQGIVAGVGNNKFNPNGNVTAAQFARMLLSALGYGENDEFIGANWKTNVTKYAARAKLFDGNYAANPDAAANREEAALYAFNAMFADKVIYSALLGDYLSTAGIGATATSIGTFADDYGLKETNNNVRYDYKKGFMVGQVKGVDAEASDIGRFVKVWYQGDTAVAGPYYADNLLATKYDGTTAAEWVVRGRNYVAAADKAVVYYVDGEQVAGVPAIAAGNKVDIIDTDWNGDFDLVIVTTYTAATVRKLATNKNGSVTITFAGSSITDAPDNLVGYEELKAGDVVYYNYNKGNEKYYITKAETVEGQKTAQNVKDSRITFAGTIYFQSPLAVAKNYLAPGSTQIINNGEAGMAFNTDSIIYLDAEGNVIAYSQEVEVTPDQYAVLIDAAKITTSGLEGGTMYQAKLLLPDGTTTIVTLAAKGIDGKDLSTLSIGDNTTTNTAIINKWYTYTVNKAGQYTLTSVKDADQSKVNANVVQGKVKFDGTTLSNAKTTFIVATKNKSGAVVYSVYTGYANLPSSGKAVYSQSVLGLANVATLVYINATGDDSYGTSTVVDYAFIANTGYTTYSTGVNAEYYAYTAVVNGELAQINAGKKDLVKSEGLYAVTYDANGYVVAVAEDTTLFLNSYDELNIVSDDLLTIGGKAYAYNRNTVAYIYDAEGNLTVSEVVDVANVQDDVKLTSIKVAGNNDVTSQLIAEIYVVLG